MKNSESLSEKLEKFPVDSLAMDIELGLVIKIKNYKFWDVIFVVVTDDGYEGKVKNMRKEILVTHFKPHSGLLEALYEKV